MRCHALRAAAAVTLGIVSMAGAGCGTSQTPSTARTNPAPGGNGVDLAFIDRMLRHHQTAIAMAQIAQTDAEHEAVSDLAAIIIDANMGEIEEMRQLGAKFAGAGLRPDRVQWPSTSARASVLRRLRVADPFDKAFIALMRAHQERSIAMAGIELNAGHDPDTREIARRIIAVQREAIGQMLDWRRVWYGSAVGAAA